ncbi:MAG: glycosyltransferase family 2 protein [Planctomycetes bacterium]|nr:glycosyltransferase family 2 protein [Planctomycetota bacterium]
MIVVYLFYIACFLLPAVLVALYYLFLMVARLLGARAFAPAGANATHTFAIVIPAHNEEQVITNVLRSCAGLDYPANKFQVFVIADNCSDCTAEVAGNSPATCLERNDAKRTGKGYALEWAFDHILPMGHDAVVVLDADCLIDKHALRVFDRCLEEGNRVLQANYVLSNPDASPISYVARVGNVLEYDFFYAPKSTLGLAVMLVGTGMVFHRKVLQDYPWRAYSLVEDAEYTLTLVRHGVHVRFVANVNVFQAGVDRIQQLTVQRARWAGGTLRLGKQSAVRLIVKGLTTRRILLVDAGLTLLIVTRPLVFLHLSLTLAMGMLLFLLEPSPISRVLLGVGIGALAIYSVYLSVGVAMVGLNVRRIRYLLLAPVVLGIMAIVAVKSGISRRTAWVRTPR